MKIECIYYSVQSRTKIKYLVETLNDQVVTKKKPFLGICVGMQILADYGYENQKTRGLSWINGDVKPLKNFLDSTQNLKIPHMGWNSLSIYKNNNLFHDITANDQFYFVHSYFFFNKSSNNFSRLYSAKFLPCFSYRNFVS